MGCGFIVQLAFAEPVQLLRQQIGRTSVGAGATADTAFFFLLFAHLTCRRGQQTVGDFDDRNVQPGQGKAHQRPAHNDHLIAARTEAGLLQQMTHRRTQPRPDVTRLRNGLACQRHYAFGQRFPVDHRAFHRVSRTDVLHQYANVRRAAAVRNLFPGQNLRQLFCTAGRVFSGNNAQANVVAARQHRTQHGDRLRLVIFNADQHFARLQNMGKDANPFDDLRGAVLHQAIISGDVRLALCGVDNQGLNFIATTAQFGAGREACAAKTGHAELVDALDQGFAALGAVIAPAVTVDPAVFTVRLDHDA
ncbi:hypothetical protein D3C71_1316210 [compost metagenome]